MSPEPDDRRADGATGGPPGAGGRAEGGGTGGSGAGGGPRRRWVTVALAVSLALNLLVAGVLAGSAALRLRGGPEPGPSALRGLGYEPFVAALPDAARRDLTRAARVEAGALAFDREALRAEFAALLAQLRADSFDAAGFEALLGTQARRLDDRRRLGRELLLAQIAKMGPAERRAFADRLEHSFRARPRLKPARH